ncbi:MAG: orotate phosphoribosyltransferase [Candidatus Diapherotrites archaeon]
MDKKEIAKELFEINAVKFGLFTLKSGLKSPVYIDLRILASYPKTLKKIGKILGEISKGLEFDLIAGIPYAAIPIATAVSLEFNWPMIYPRKEVKEYGTKKAIEGIYRKGQKVLVIDDLITTGGSKIEAIEPLKEAGLQVKDVCVLIDREQGGKKELKEKGISLHSVLTITELIDFLEEMKKISKKEAKSIRNYFAGPNEWQEGK